MNPSPQFVDEHLLRIGEVTFHCSFPIGDPPSGRVVVMKPRRLVERYVALCETMQPKRIVELGIDRGGSTALLSELTRPERLVAVELATEAPPLLTDYIAEHGLTDVVRPHYGLDQADRTRLTEIVDHELGNAAIDLVVDDASHRYEPSRASFEVLFPRLRRGGIYVIEDWSWQHRYADRMVETLAHDSPEAAQLRAVVAERLAEERAGLSKREAPLTRLVSELIHVRTRKSDVVEDLTVDEHWVTIRRGSASLDPGSFSLADLYHDHFGLLGPG